MEKIYVYFFNIKGFFNMGGNVLEYVLEENIIFGGSWLYLGFYLRKGIVDYYDFNSSFVFNRGFRIVMEIKNE